MPLNVSGSDSLYWKTGIDNTGLEKGSKKSVGIIAGLAKNVSALDVFVGLSVSASLAFKKIAKDSYDFSRKFESAMKEVQTISLAVQKNYDGISQTIMDLSKGVPDMATKLTRAYYQIVSAGYDGAKGLELLEASSKLAVAGVTDTFTAADTLTSIMNAYGKEAGTAMEISDKLFTVVKLGKVTMTQLGGSLSNVTGLAAQAGIDFNDLMSIVAKGTKTMRPERIIVGITGILNALIKEPQDKAKEVIKELGLQFDLATIRSQGFNAFLDDLMEKTGGNIKTLQKLFPNVRGLSGILAVATESGGLFSDVLDEMANSAGATEEAFKTMIETTDNQLAILGNMIKAKLKPIGDSILAQVNSIAKVLNKALGSKGEGYLNIQEKVIGQSVVMKAKFEDLSREILMLAKKQNKSNFELKKYSETIETINTEYKDYLPNLITEKDTYFEISKNIKIAQKNLEDYWEAKRKQAITKDIQAEMDALNTRNALLQYAIDLHEEGALVVVMANEEQTKSWKNVKQEIESNNRALEDAEERYKRALDLITEHDKFMLTLIDHTSDHTKAIKEQKEAYLELGKSMSKLADIPKFKEFDLDFSKGTLTLTELMRVFHESIEHLEAFRQAGIDTTDILTKNWESFTDNVKQYYGEDSATYIATLNLKKDADREYFEWKKEKWIEEHQFMVNTLGVIEDGYNTFISTILDMEMTGKERREAIWDSMKSSFVNLLADMLKRTISDILIRMAITKTSEALAITSAAVTGAAVASSWATAAAMASLASFGANAIPAMAGITSTVSLAQLLSAIKLNKGGEVQDKIERKSEGGEMNTGSDRNVDSVLTLLTKKEIVTNRESSQWKNNREILLGVNKDKDYIYKNFIPRNIGGAMDRASDIRIPSFPSRMSINSDQLERLIKATKAQTMNQVRKGNPNIYLNIKSDLDMERFIIEFDKTKTRMTDRGYNTND